MQRLTLLLLLLFLIPALMTAQDATGRVIGTVVDPSGAAVPDAKITVVNADTKVVRSATTNNEGDYQVLQLPIGRYSIVVEKVGFAKTLTDSRPLRINESLRFDIKLEVSTTSEVVEVKDAAAAVETVNATLGGSVTSRPIVDLPLNGRNVLDLVGLEAGATPQRDAGPNTGVAYSISGGRVDSMTMLYDGGLNNNLMNNAVVVNPNPDTIAEFKVLTSNYNAEFGRNAGGVVSVAAKSGTNDYHGSLYEYLRNEALNANSFFNNRNGLPRDILKRNQFGGTVGGPISIPHVFSGKERLFFFAGYQGQRLSAVQSASAVPTYTPAELAGDFSHSVDGGPDPGVVDYLTQFPYFQPDPAKAAQGILDPTRINSVAKNFIKAGLIPTAADGLIYPHGSQTIDRNEINGKVDLVVTQNDRVSLSMSGSRSPQVNPWGFNGGNVPGWPYRNQTNNYLANLGYTKIFTPALLNEAHFVAQRNNGTQAIPGTKLPTGPELGMKITPDNATGPPLVWFDSGLTIGFSPQGPTNIVNNTFNFTDALTWTHGRHTSKAGFQFTNYQGNIKYDFYANGYLDFAGSSGGIGSGNDRADFLMGLADEYYQSSEAPTNVRTKHFGAFLQDEWRVTKNLVLTFGLRYEYATPKYDTGGKSFSLKYGQTSTVFPNAPIGLLFPGDPGAPRGANFADKNDFAPRFGFAWSPGSDHKTAIRGGFGLFYDILKAEDNLQYNGQAPFFGYADLWPNPLEENPTSEVGFLADPFGYMGAMNPFPSKTPAKDIDFDASGFLPFGGNGVYFVNPHLRTPYVYQYNLSVQREMARNLVVEAAYVGNSSHKLTGLVDANPFVLGTSNRLFNAQEGNLPYAFSYLLSFDNLGTANYNSLQTSVKYNIGETYLHLAWTYGHALDTMSGFRERTSRVPYYNHRQFYGSGDEDVRHTVVLSGSLEVPFRKLWESGPKRLVRGWSLRPILKWNTGFPLDIYALSTQSRTTAGPSAAGDPYLVHVNLGAPGVTLYDPKPAQTINGKTGNFWFDPKAFNRNGLLESSSYYINNPSARTYGTLGRNAFRGPGRTNLDLTLAKRIPFKNEGTSAIEFHAEAFNVLNLVEFRNPSTNFTGSTFGQISDTYSPRIVQLAVRLEF
jgi:hypothetical protein